MIRPFVLPLEKKKLKRLVHEEVLSLLSQGSFPDCCKALFRRRRTMGLQASFWSTWPVLWVKAQGNLSQNFRPSRWLLSSCCSLSLFLGKGYALGARAVLRVHLQSWQAFLHLFQWPCLLELNMSPSDIAQQYSPYRTVLLDSPLLMRQTARSSTARCATRNVCKVSVFFFFLI